VPAGNTKAVVGAQFKKTDLTDWRTTDRPVMTHSQRGKALLFRSTQVDDAGEDKKKMQKE